MSTQARIAIVTGASAGFGSAIAFEMASWAGRSRSARGARTGWRRSRSRPRRGAADVYAGPLDVSDDGSVERFFEASEKALGIADVIVNNAGASRFHWIEQTDTRWLRKEVETNLIGLMLVTHRALVLLLAREIPGDVVMVSSDAVRRPRPGQPAYGASKAGLENYADALGASLEGTGVRVIKLRVGPALSEFASGWDMSPDLLKARTEYWASVCATLA